jgi:hypothetical protein
MSLHLSPPPPAGQFGAAHSEHGLLVLLYLAHARPCPFQDKTRAKGPYAKADHRHIGLRIGLLFDAVSHGHGINLPEAADLQMGHCENAVLYRSTHPRLRDIIMLAASHSIYVGVPMCVQWRLR